MSAASPGPLPRRAITVWLAILCALVISMVVLGGITRLTGSGLSMVDWNPIMGAIPPLNDADWQATFERYQQFPQYKLVNAGMSLGEFKAIFFWEYLHRVVGRLIGVVFLGPWLFLVLTKRVDRRLALRLGGALLLGGLQGALGWFMVKSGLADQPAVSHYRLAAHLVLALVVLAWLLWLLLEVVHPSEEAGPPAGRGFRLAALGLTVVVLLQITYGAFTAGLKAGYGFNTFPSMNGQWIPDGATSLSPLWSNLFENRTTLQFLHRSIGWALLACTLGLWFTARRAPLSARQRWCIGAVAGLVCLQFGLGIATLLLVVPIELAVLHQLGACLVFSSAVVLNHSLRGRVGPAVVTRSLPELPRADVVAT